VNWGSSSLDGSKIGFSVGGPGGGYGSVQSGPAGKSDWTTLDTGSSSLNGSKSRSLVDGPGVG
jgi:hypothetical protein